MKVLTLHPAAFELACRHLAGQARDFAPQLIVGIPRGGSYVGQIIAREYADAEYIEIGGQRAGTPRKGRLSWLLRLLPTFVVDRLRMAEARRLARRKHTVGLLPSPSSLPAASRILVVDDAVDSGATMAAVVNFLKRALPESSVRSAAITVTTPSPLIEPDYAIYRGDTLIRFPWSNDYTPRR